ncbi:MAG: DUF6291 domain-containing protein [Prevotellaceae bacterium]|jgi:hypothetical protein|nr:DUF6291 domain-containing protein [Prevotellaceae bacterium]
MNRDSFIFYRSFYEAIRDLPRDIQGEVYTAILEYGLNGITTENLKPVARSIFTLIRPIIDTNNKKYSGGCEGAEYGKLGGRPTKPLQNPKKTPAKPLRNPKKTPTIIDVDDDVDDDVDVDVDVDDKKKKREKKIFSPPALIDVENYFTENGYTTQAAKKFFDFYQAGNWKDSNGKQVQNWKQKSISVWFKPENQQQTPQYKPPKAGA